MTEAPFQTFLGKNRSDLASSENPFQSPEVQQTSFHDRPQRDVFWSIAGLSIAVCLMLACIVPEAAIAFGLLVLLPGLGNAYLDCRRRRLAGPVDGQDQWGTIVIAFLQLIPFILLGGLVMFVLGSTLVDHARATAVNGLGPFDVLGAYLTGFFAGTVTYLFSVCLLLVWKGIRKPVND